MFHDCGSEIPTELEPRTFWSSVILSCLPLNRPDVDFDVRLMRAVQVMDIPMLKDFINALVMDSLTYGKKLRFFTPSSSPKNPRTLKGNIQQTGMRTCRELYNFPFRIPHSFVLEALSRKVFQAVTVMSAKVVVKEQGGGSVF